MQNERSVNFARAEEGAKMMCGVVAERQEHSLCEYICGNDFIENYRNGVVIWGC